MKWTKTKDESIADGYGRNVIYTSDALMIAPDGPGWVLYVNEDDAVGRAFRTLREAKAAAEFRITNWRES